MTGIPNRALLVTRTRAERERGLDYGGVAGDGLMRLRPGVRVHAADWERLYGEAQLRTLAHAVALRTESPRATNSHTTAAAIHGLPLFRTRADRVHLTIPGPSSRHDSPDVVRHHLPLSEADVEIIDGLRVTTLSRTVYDVIRMTSLEAGVSCFDAALRQVAWDDDTREYDAVAAAGFRQGVLDRIIAHTGARGIRHARFVTDFADGRAQLPGESVSRLWMWQLGMPDPELQRRVELDIGGLALLDFAWPALGRWAEFDGEVKYTDPGMLAGRSADEVRHLQNAREDAVRRATGWEVSRWGWDQAPSFASFAALMRRLRFTI